ncbi:MAG: flagellar cap protein FliD N-terminal domain-containing protein, partial [Planctomycetaceae bacterium]
MSGISTGVGLFSGINFTEIVDQLISIQRTPAARMESRVSMLQQRQGGFKSLQANLLTLTTSATSLSNETSFQKHSTTNTGASQLTVSTNTDVQPGNYHFRTLRLSSTHEAISKGFANAGQQTLDSGTLTIGRGGNVVRPTQLDVLNEGNGFQRGMIRVTDRSGAVAEIDLTRVQTVEDVLQAINDNYQISVEASADGNHLALVDTSGATTTNLTVEDIGTGTAASDLGLASSVGASTLVGSDIYSVTGDFSLEQINDGNGLYRLKGAPDVRITLTDDATIEVNLDDAFNLNDVITAINDHSSNGGKVTAALIDGRLELTDNTGGGGSSAFQVEDINGAVVTRQLGLDSSAVSQVITGRSLTSGINSVMLHNLRGGQGIDQLGELSLTDRAGRTTTIDLKSATSLNDIINGINAAQDS